MTNFQRPLTPWPLIPVNVLQQSTGVGKSRMFRKTAVNILNHTKHEGVVVIAVDRHDLGQEQLDALAREHPNTALVVRIWRGRGADDPEQPGKLMCWRNDEAEEVSAHGLSVEISLCKQWDRKDKKEILCPFYEMCGHQRQRQPGNIWFVAHELLLHEVPEVFGERVLQVFADEDPLDAFFFGIDKAYEVPLNALTKPPRIKDEFIDMEERDRLKEARTKLHEALVKLPEGPVPLRALSSFSKETAIEMSRLEWLGKVEVKISPDWDRKRVKAALAAAAHNKVVIRLAELWRLIAQAVELRFETVVEVQRSDGIHKAIERRRPEFSGCIEIVRNDDSVPMIRMKGLKHPGRGWQTPTLIGSATLDAELLKAVWVPAKEEYGIWGEYYSGKWKFNELPKAIVARPKHVVVRQTVDASFSKTWSLPTEPEKLVERTREILAVVMRESVQLAPLHSLMICHKAMEEIIVPPGAGAPGANFHVPPWLEIAHHGAITGLDKWKTVRAQFVVGRPMPSAELITLQAEAITGEYIAQRNYVQREAAIHVVPDADGNTIIDVDQYEHPHPIAQRLLRRVVWGGVLQEVGRTRYILRERDDPLDIWLLNDVSVPELGRVIPVQWGSDEART